MIEGRTISFPYNVFHFFWMVEWIDNVPFHYFMSKTLTACKV